VVAGIVSRGYGAKIDTPRAATVADQAAEVGDERSFSPAAAGCPVWVGPDRGQSPRPARRA